MSKYNGVDERYVAGVDYDEDDEDDRYDDERPLSVCDHCEGGDRCACALGQGARYDECDCGPTGEEVAQ